MVRNENKWAMILFPVPGNPCWREEKKTFDSKIGTLEPYTESLPSMLILTAVWITETKIRDNDEFQG